MIKRKCVLSALVKLRPSIVFLQETHMSNTSFQYFKSHWFFHYYHSPGSSKSRGTAILISKLTQFSLDSSDPSGRFVFLNGSLNNKPVTLANLYVPNQQQLDFIDQSLSTLQQFRTGDIILGGDFNHVIDLFLDKTPNLKNRIKSPSYTKLKALLDKFDLVDIWRLLHPTEHDYTYFSAPHQVHTRIDFIFLSSALVRHVFSSDIGAQVWSDHALISCTLHDLINSPVTRADWILNSSLLSKVLVQSEIASEINNFFQDNSGCGVSLSSYYKKEKEQIRFQLLNKIKNLEQLHKHTCSKKVFKKLLQERKALELLEITVVQKQLYLLKQRSWYKSPKSLRYLSWRMKSKQNDRAVPVIMHHSGKQTTDPSAIANVFAEYYHSLYQIFQNLQQF